MTGKQPRRNSDQISDEQPKDEAVLTLGEDNEDWVASSLKQLYRSTVEEGIPDDMLALLDALDDDEDATDGDSSSAAGGDK